MTSKQDTALRSNLAEPPGSTLAEELEARGMTQRELAALCARPVQVINEIIRGKKLITPETALELERALGVSAEFWLNQETRYQLTIARNKVQKTA